MLLNRKSLYPIAGMIFIWAIFDGVISYLTPLIMVQNGLSKTMMGMIISTSSVFGAGFDFILSKYLNNTHFRRLYLAMFVLCFFYPLLLWQAKSVWLFLLAMAVWGLYYDLLNFATFDFVSRRSLPHEHSSYFGFVDLFKSFGYMLAPILAGLMIGNIIGAKPFLLAFILLCLAFICYGFAIAIFDKQKKDQIKVSSFKAVNVIKEVHLWVKIGRYIYPVLIMTTILYISDAFFWTIGPLFSQNFVGQWGIKGLFMVAYSFPCLFLTGWLITPLTNKFGKKRTAHLVFILGSLLLLTLGIQKYPLYILITIFTFSLLTSLAYPSIKGTFADYISEAPIYEKEIEGLVDFCANLGYIIGPVLSGILADSVGYGVAFSLLGGLNLIVVLILLFITPKQIQVK